MSYNPINLFLPISKLTIPNYVDWKYNLDIILTSNELKWVTQEIVPSIPNEHSTQEEKDVIIVGRRQIRRPSVTYLGHWITCCNISRCLCQQLMIFYLVSMRCLVARAF